MDSVSSLSTYYTIGISILFVFLSYALPENIIYYYSLASTALLSTIITYYCYPTVKRWFFHGRVNSHNKAVLITGSDSGFGYELAMRLDSQGYQVFAGCSSVDGEGAKALKENCTSRVHVIELDVTNEESIAKALSYVKENLEDREFWAVVNSAEVLQGFDVGWGKIADFERCIAVNAIGPVRVTRAFLPLLHKFKGRVVTVASVRGRICLPHLTPYTMSKYAAVAFSECLRLELWRFNMKVISVEPELFKTPLTANLSKQLEQALQEADKSEKEMYGEKYFDDLKRYIASLERYQSSDVTVVVDSLNDAVTLEEPDDIYAPSSSFLRRVLAVGGQNLPLSFTSTVYDSYIRSA